MSSIRRPPHSNPLPEYMAADITPRVFAQSIQQQGCVLLRGVIPQSDLVVFQARAREAYARRDAEFARGNMPEEFSRTMYRFGHVLGSELDAPGEQFAIVQQLVLKTKLIQLLFGFYGSAVGFILNNCLPRRQDPQQLKNPNVPYHQDAAFMGDTFFILNAWTPLMMCGDDAPGLEVLRNGTLTTLLHPPHWQNSDKTPYEQIAFEPDWVEQTYGLEKCWHPVMMPGDVLVFSNFTLHRTYHTSAMTEERISLELRCAALTPQLEQSGWGIMKVEAAV